MPHAQLQPIAPELWGAEHDLYLPGGVHFRGRMTVLRLASGGLLLHSPIPLVPALSDELRALGPVEAVVAPSLLHHLFAGPALAAHPAARSHAPAALRQKRPDLRIDAALQVGAGAPPWAGELRPIFIAGVPAMDEWVFWHPATRTLLLTDLVFHILEASNWQSRLLFRALGYYGRFAQSRVLGWLTRDRAALQRSIGEVLALPVERVVPAHGPVLAEGAHAALAGALGHLRPPAALSGGAPSAGR